MGVQALAMFQRVSACALAVFAYIAILFILEVDVMLPYNSGFAVAILWAGSMLSGQAAKLVGLPPLLGMLCIGIFIKNAGDLARGLPEQLAAGIRAFGLMNILMRGGLEMDISAVQRLGTAVVRLTVIPGVTEATVSGMVAAWMFDMPIALGLALGFILAAVSPAIVVGGMFDLQNHGYGTEKGIPSLVVAAASFDDVVAISGFALCSGLAMGQGDVIKDALHGPIDISLGICFGIIGACIAALTKLWDKRWKIFAVILLLGLVFTFAAKYAHFAGAGALASLVMAAGFNQLVSRGAFSALSSGPNKHIAHHVERDLAKLWHTLSEPLLFSVIGNSLDLSVLAGNTIHKVVGVIMIGVTIRCFAAYGATCGSVLSCQERIFVALAWMPKATVQAALGSVPLDLVKTMIDKDADPDKYDRYIEHGNNILTMAVFSILLTAPAGLLIIQRLGPRMLEHEDTVTEFKTEDPSTSSTDKLQSKSRNLEDPPEFISSSSKDFGTVVMHIEALEKVPNGIGLGSEVTIRSKVEEFHGVIREFKWDVNNWLEDIAVVSTSDDSELRADPQGVPVKEFDVFETDSGGKTPSISVELMGSFLHDNDIGRNHSHLSVVPNKP